MLFHPNINVYQNVLCVKRTAQITIFYVLFALHLNQWISVGFCCLISSPSFGQPNLWKIRPAFFHIKKVKIKSMWLIWKTLRINQKKKFHFNWYFEWKKNVHVHTDHTMIWRRIFLCFTILLKLKIQNKVLKWPNMTIFHTRFGNWHTPVNRSHLVINQYFSKGNSFRWY